MAYAFILVACTHTHTHTQLYSPKVADKNSIKLVTIYTMTMSHGVVNVQDHHAISIIRYRTE